MIRCREEQNFWLFRQDDHAKLSADIARNWGNSEFNKPEPWESTLLAVEMHDAGWTLQDNKPTLSSGMFPLDVFEAPRHIAMGCWQGSTERAIKKDPYAGLLVALHVLSLSSLSVSQNQPGKFDPQQLRQQFDLNKFQHQQIEALETLRAQLGLRVDRPLKLGLAEGWIEPEEQKLRNNFRFVQAMDQLSLAICCTNIPQPEVGPVHATFDAPPIRLNITRPKRNILTVSPWPFATQAFRVIVPYKSIPATTYGGGDLLQLACGTARQETLTVDIIQTPKD